VFSLKGSYGLNLSLLISVIYSVNHHYDNDNIIQSKTPDPGVAERAGSDANGEGNGLYQWSVNHLTGRCAIPEIET